MRVTFTDDAGNEESVTSAATPTVTQRALRLQAAAVDEATLILTYNNDLDVGVTLPPSAFTVTVAANTRSVGSVSMAGRAVTLTLASAVESGEAVTVSYAKPEGSSFIRDTQGNTAGSFSGETVTNNTAAQENSAAIGAPTINGTARVGETLTATTTGISDTDGLTNASFTYQWLADDADISGATTSSYTVVAANAGKAIKVRVSFTDDEGNEESVTSAATAAVTQPPMTATFQDRPESHDGVTAFTFELRFSESPASGFGYATVQNHAFTVTDGSVSNVHRLEPGKNVRWEITVTPDSDADVTMTLNATTDCSAEGAICNGDGGKLSGGLEMVVPGPTNQQSVQENSEATGAPTINGTAQVGESLTATTTGISDADGLVNASFTYQWLAADADISGATGSIYTLVAADQGKAIKVRVSFTDDEGNEESVTSAATAAVTQPPMTATFHDRPESHDGATAFTFELGFSESPASGFGYATVQNHAFTVTDGSVSNVRRLEPGKNVRWEITVTPDSDADVTIALNATTDCSAEGAICNGDGVKLSGGLELVVPGPTSQQSVQENSEATGAPTINGTAQVGESLTATTTGISDADGLANASFTYQWLADDTDISGATGSSYVVATADEGKSIKVRVSFTDDAGNAETLTSAATTAVAKPPLTATVHDKPSSHDGSTAFTFELRLSEAPVDAFSYTTLQNHALTVTGGTLPKVRRLDAGKNVRWGITVQPSSNADVTIVLPITTDCAAQGAICTSDGRKLSSRVELTISGPGG